MAAHQRKVFLFKSLEDEVAPSQRDSVSQAMPAASRSIVKKVPSLLFDIELEDKVVEEHLVDDDLEDTLQQLRPLVNARTLIEQQLQRQVHEAHAEAAKEGIKMDAHHLATRLHLPGHSFSLRSALGGSEGGSCLQQLRHFFLTCTPASGANRGSPYVIDPCFREQFEIANPTPQYSIVLSEVPREFVGSEENISKLVTLLCTQIKRSFQATGGTLPPWRHCNSMLSKWQPRRSTDVPVPARPQPYKSSSHSKPAKDKQEDAQDASATAEEASDKEGNGSKSKPPAQAERAPPASPSAYDLPNSGGKRGRNFPASSKSSSLLAVKLRGVDMCRSPRPTPTYQPIFQGRSKA